MAEALSRGVTWLNRTTVVLNCALVTEPSDEHSSCILSKLYPPVLGALDPSGPWGGGGGHMSMGPLLTLTVQGSFSPDTLKPNSTRDLKMAKMWMHKSSATDSWFESRPFTVSHSSTLSWLSCVSIIWSRAHLTWWIIQFLFHCLDSNLKIEGSQGRGPESELCAVNVLQTLRTKSWTTQIKPQPRVCYVTLKTIVGCSQLGQV